MAITSSNPSPGAIPPEVQAYITGGGTKEALGRVYMGRTFAKPTARDEKYGLATKDIGRWLSPDEAIAEFYKWPDKKRRDLLAQFIVGGILPPGSGVIEAQEGWRKLVDASAKFGAVGQEVSPFDLLSSYVKAAGGAGKNAWQQNGAFEVNIVTGEKRYAGPGVYLGNGVARQTDTRTDLTDPDTAKAIATKLFQNMMGRDPGHGELGGFAKALSAAEANSPVTQTTDTTYNQETGQAISQDTRSEGGMTAEARAYLGEQRIKKKKEYGATQAATTYQNAFDQLILGAPQ